MRIFFQSCFQRIQVLCLTANNHLDNFSWPKHYSGTAWPMARAWLGFLSDLLCGFRRQARHTASWGGPRFRSMPPCRVQRGLFDSFFLFVSDWNPSIIEGGPVEIHAEIKLWSSESQSCTPQLGALISTISYETSCRDRVSDTEWSTLTGNQICTPRTSPGKISFLTILTSDVEDIFWMYCILTVLKQILPDGK